MKPADEKKRQQVLARAQKAMDEVKASTQQKEAGEAYLDFMVSYASVEAGYKVLLQNYLLATRHKATPIESLCIESRDIPRVLSFYGIRLSETDRDNVFNGRQKKGERKARALRNSLAHRPNKNALDELVSSHESLFASMKAFRVSIDEEVEK